MGQAVIDARPASRHGLILGVLALGGAAYALLQSLVVPALTVLQHDLHASSSGVAWIFTSYLLAASVVTPIAGRLGDIFGKKRVLVVALAGLALGSLLAAVVSTLSLMIVARVIQGLGGAFFPLAFGIIRDEFPPATRSRGSSSRMIEKASGKIPPPTPWITRPTSITASDDATAEISVPAARRTSTISRSRSLPYMSPSRPTIGVVTEALSRKAVSTQPTDPSDVPSASWICGSAGTTSDCSSA